MAKESEDKKQPKPEVSKTSGSSRSKKWLRRNGKKVLAVLVILVVAWLAYGYIHTRNELNNARNPEQAGKTEIQKIENQIGKVVLLPTNDNPTLATVSDAQKLRAQIFFKDAQDGDKVLIYPKAGTAILYRPSENKVVEYAPVNLGSK